MSGRAALDAVLDQCACRFANDQLRDEARLELEALVSDQTDWRKGVRLIRSAAGLTDPNLCCVTTAERVMEIRAENERLADAIKNLLFFCENYDEKEAWTEPWEQARAALATKGGV